jgi:peptidoglycan/xylan/chitin deacetylase (PgdA/CDA1 family)
MPQLDQEERQEQEALDPIERKIPYFLRIELYLPLIVIGGISLAVLLYAQGMIGAGWSFGKQEQPGSVAKAFVDAPPGPVVLYTSPTTKNFLAKVSGSHDVLLKQWRDYFKEHRREFREVADPAALAQIGNAVIVVPSALALDDVERKALVEHHRKGGSILATGPFGARDGAGNWVGWGLMLQLFGARVVDEVETAAEKNFIVTAADTPINVHIPSGTRYWIGRIPENVLRFDGGQVGARFLDWSRTADGKGPSVAYGEKDGGRWVLYGFSENAWDPAPTGLRKLSDGALDWLQRKPAVAIASWPNGFKAAHLITMNVDDAPENAVAFASSLDILKMRGTFFVVADAAARAPAAMHKLVANHEIAYHGDGLTGFKDQGKPEQERRVKEMQRRISEVRIEKPILGFRAPAESYDARTEEALQSAGLRYHAVDPNRTDARLPLFAKANRATPDRDVVVLPRTQRDDIVFMQRKDAPMNEVIGVMKGELGLILEEGALGMLSVHSRNFAKDSVMSQAVPAYLLELAEQRQRVWLATGSEVADWWRKRVNLRASLNAIGKRYELEVSNVGEAPVEGATVLVYHPRSATVVVSATKAWMPEATVRRVDEFSSQVLFGAVGPGHHQYTLVFE